MCSCLFLRGTTAQFKDALWLSTMLDVSTQCLHNGFYQKVASGQGRTTPQDTCRDKLVAIRHKKYYQKQVQAS